MYFCINQEWIIFSPPQIIPSKNKAISLKPKSSKKTVSLKFWKDNKFESEAVELIWSENKEQNIQYLVNSWLTTLDEEGVTTKKTTLQTAMLSQSGQDCYLSFDRNPFDKESSTFTKWMWVEGLLKTLRENQINLQEISFLIHHKAMTDYHLDFSQYLNYIF